MANKMFESHRIYLRKATMEDTDIYHEWRMDTEVMKWTLPFVESYSYEDTRDFMENVIVGYDSSQNLMVVDKESGLTIGIISLVNVDYINRNAECIIDIGEKDFWNLGYGSEALKLILDFAFKEMNLHRMYLRVFSFNKPAIKMYRKLGFKEEGLSRESIYRDGAWHDIIHMGLLKREYLNY